MTTLSAYTGPSPKSGYVGYFNASLHEGIVTITVRPESDDGNGTAAVTIPVEAAITVFADALQALHVTASEREVRLEAALRALEHQALQSPDLIASEWGQEALSMARTALTEDKGE